MSFSRVSKCETCKYFISNSEPPFATCKAYPTGIPTRILCGEKNHDKHRPFDKGYRYELKKE